MNKAQIMKRAWEIKREDSRNIFGLCLKMAWAEARKGTEMTQREKDEKEAMEQGAQYGKTKVAENRWQKYGKDRTYVEVRVYTNAWNLKRTIKVGYQDNKTGEWITDPNLY